MAGYWEAEYDGRMAESVYSENNKKRAYNDGVTKGVEDAFSSIYGAMFRPNWNETYNNGWNMTNYNASAAMYNATNSTTGY